MAKKDLMMPWWQKYNLTVEEAAIYFNIGERVLRRFIKEHDGENFFIYNGTKILIKRRLFEKYMDDKITAL